MIAIDSERTIEPPDAMPHAPRIAGYRVVRRLGLGGMAMVYLAVQESLDREVAIKVMRPLRHVDEAQVLRFEHEARIIAKLEHPGIVGIHEVGRTLDGELYYVMPYLARGDLSMRDYRDDETGLAALVSALLDALGYAHARGIVHRDVKPENVLFDNADRPQLADFGIALAHDQAMSRVTGDGLVIGSGAQMSPEQARAGTVDGRADLYSLGVLTYELLTGVLPFHSSDPLALALMHAQDPVPDLPPEKAHWQAFVDKAMAKKPEQRFRNAQAMQRGLEPVRRHLSRAQGPVGRARSFVRASPPALLVAFGALVALSIVTLALPRAWRMNQPTPEPVSIGLVPEANAAGASAADDAFAAELAAARTYADSGAWFAPAGANASETYLDILRRAPGHAGATAGLDEVFTAAADALVAALPRESLAKVRERHEQIGLVADAAGRRGSPALEALPARAAPLAVERARAQVAAYDADDATAWLAFAATLGATDDVLAPVRTALAAMPRTGVVTRDGNGPSLLFVPPRKGSTGGLYVMRDEVLLGDYTTFATQTGRAAGRCRSMLSPLRLLDRRDWKDPGFTQGRDEPVVCVAHDDAQAYAAWLSQLTGKRYRLPTLAEWRHVAQLSAARGGACELGNVADRSASGGTRHACGDGRAHTAPAGRFRANAYGLHDVFGNVAEWTSDCADASNGKACARRLVVGRSWRSGPSDALDATRTIPAERGFDDVGFRLVREP